MANFIKAVNNKTYETHIFNSQKEASEKLGINVHLISRVFTSGVQRKDYRLHRISGLQYSAQKMFFKECGRYSPFELTIDDWDHPAFRD